MDGTAPSAPNAPLVTRHDVDRIAVLTLSSPANRNALSGRLLADLTAHLDDIGADDTLHGVLLRSAGTVFSSGADLKEAATVDMRERTAVIIGVQRALAALPVPVVARVDGPARAGGLGLLASSDVVVCRDDVTFALTEVRLGLAAGVISIPLLHRCANRPLVDWLLTGRVFTAAEAAQAGLVTRVVAADDVDDAVETVLADLRRGIRQGLVEAKRLANADLVAAFDARGDAMSQLSARLFHSDVARAAMAAALPRR